MVKLDFKAIYEWPFTLQLLLVLPLCALIFYLAYVFDFTSLNKTLLASQQQENDLKQQVELIFKQQIKLENELTQLAVLERMISEWHGRLVQPAKLPDLLNDILKIGTANGLKFDQLQPGVEAKDDIYMKVPIKIAARGGYHQVAGFVSQVANLPSLVVVRNVSLDKPPLSPTQGKNFAEQVALRNILTVEMILEVYNLSGSPSLETK